MAHEDKGLWLYYKDLKSECIEDAKKEFKKNSSVKLYSLEGCELINTKEQLDIIASRNSFIVIIEMIKNYFKGDNIKDFMNFMDSSYADKKDIEARVKIEQGDYQSLEVFLMRYWVRNLKRSIPNINIKNEKDFYAHLDYLRKLPDFKTYGQHFWTLHSSNKAHPIYLSFYKKHQPQILKDFPLIPLKNVKINDVNWID